MPKQEKKRLRKIKDKMVHCANELRDELEDANMANDCRDSLDDSRSLLIESINKLVEATNI